MTPPRAIYVDLPTIAANVKRRYAVMRTVFYEPNTQYGTQGSLMLEVHRKHVRAITDAILAEFDCYIFAETETFRHAHLYVHLKPQEAQHGLQLNRSAS